MAQEKTLTFFCAEQQADTEHTLDVDANGEVVLTCTHVSTGTSSNGVGGEVEASVVCGRFVKLPRTTTADDLKAYAEAHRAANQGQISVASIEAKKAELLAAFDEPAA